MENNQKDVYQKRCDPFQRDEETKQQCATLTQQHRAVCYRKKIDN